MGKKVQQGKGLAMKEQDWTRNDEFKLDKCKFKIEIDRNVYTHMEVEKWNKLSSQVTKANTMQRF